MITITMRTPVAFDFHKTIMSHGWYQLAPNVYDQEAQTLVRPHRLRDGTIVTLSVRGGKSKVLSVVVTGKSIISSQDRNDVLHSVRRMFNLDYDLRLFHQNMAKTEGYHWVSEQQVGRLLASPTIWEDLAKTVLTTNTSWSNTVTMASKLSAIDPDGIFPSPAMIATMTEEAFSDAAGAGYRGAYLYEAAQRIASGEIDLATWDTLDSDDLYKAITDLSGFGDYAAGTLMRLMGHFDKLAIDTVARKAYTHVTGHEAESDTEIRDYYEDFGKWRGLVLWMDCIRDEIEAAPQPVST